MRNKAAAGPEAPERKIRADQDPPGRRGTGGLGSRAPGAGAASPETPAQTQPKASLQPPSRREPGARRAAAAHREPPWSRAPKATREPTTRTKNTPKLQPLRAAWGSRLPPGPGVLVRREATAREGAAPHHDSPRESESRMTALSTPGLLRPPHLGKGLHRPPPSWRSLQSQWAHGSLSWPGEGTRDRSRAATGQGPSPASSPTVTPPATDSSNTGCWQVERDAGHGERKGLW